MGTPNSGGDEAVEADPEPHQQRRAATVRRSQSLKSSHYERIAPVRAHASGCGNCGRCAASHATTSEISWADIGLPGTLPRQSGAPSSGRPTMTVVRKSLIAHQGQVRTVDNGARALPAPPAGP